MLNEERGTRNEEHAICFEFRASSFGFQRRSRRMGVGEEEGVRCQVSGVRGQVSGARGQGSEVRGQRSGVRQSEIDNRKSFLLLATDLAPLDGVVQAEVN